MPKNYPYELLEDPAKLASYHEWSEEVYQDFLAFQKGHLTEQDFDRKYLRRRAILCLDMTSFTQSAIQYGALFSLLRILDVQKVCGPIFRQYEAGRVRAFADDFTVLFEDPQNALSAALEVHRRIESFNASSLASKSPARCCIGIGYGDVYAIGPDLAMGDEMNRASKLGEDTAKAQETLISEGMYNAVSGRQDCTFERIEAGPLPFAYYKVKAKH